MTFRFMNSIRKTASQIACKSVFYQWTLGGSVPEELLVKPVDQWAGNEERGRYLCSGTFSIDGEYFDLHENFWESEQASPAWMEHIHGFEWLRDLRTLGGDKARKCARDLMRSWMHDHRHWQQLAWRPDLTGRRIAMWISHYESFCASADDEFQDAFMDSLMRQARHLSRSVPGDLHGLNLLYAIKGLLYAGLAFEGRESWIEQALDLLDKELAHQVLPDGGHISRSPEKLLKTLQSVLDIRTALLAGGYPLPEKVQHAIDRMGPAVRFFRYSDRYFGLFNGSQEGDADLIDSVLAQANARGKGLQSLPCTGYERVAQGRSLLMMDTGKTPPWPHDHTAHAAPLAFEFCYGKQRVLTSCGMHPISDSWGEALRATPAHNTVTVDFRNAGEIREGGHFGRRVKNVVVVREDIKDAHLLEASHDGYVPINGVSHNRKLFLSDKGNDLRGEETLTCAALLDRPVEFAVRFHLHPRVQVSLVRDGQDALLRLPGGTGFRFQQAGGAMQLEDSVYLGQGCHPRKTKQIVVYGRMQPDGAVVKWAMKKEG